MCGGKLARTIQSNKRSGMPGIDIGPIRIHYYGIILMLGALAGAWLASREARRRGQNTEIVWDGLVWVLIGGIIGARIWHVLTPPVSMGKTFLDYLANPLDILKVWEGGLGIPGAVIGGGLALYIYCRRRKLSFPLWADIAAPGLALGQAIGRWGNYVNQEVYGKPTTLPWAVHIEPSHRYPGYAAFETFHPLFLYESIWNFALMGFLLWVGRRYESWLKAGDVFLIYLIGYPLGRFLLEFLRLDVSLVGGINANQWLMAGVSIFAGGLLYWRHRPSREKPQTAE
jgi:phosphatidylglycerol:prolipoprotein diacylglycerol transferase